MTDENVEYWIWLQQAMGPGSPKPDRLIRDMGGIEPVYSAKRGDYMSLGYLNDREMRRLCDKSLEGAKRITGACIEKGYGILTFYNMPQRLRSIYAPPCVLYTWGSLPQPDDGLYIAMVGTRNITPYGTQAATKLAEGLARYHTAVVSGMALGVDAASHKGALKGGGKTIAVIGCGIDVNYPAAHTELKRLIAKNGAVVSEYPPGTRPLRANFPVRNRIIAGLSLGCVVVEAGAHSGSLITASLATEMGRDVFAVPGSIFSPVSEGTNRLIRDGAKPVCTVVDILEEYIGLAPQSIIPQQEGQAEPEQLHFYSPAPAQKASSQKPAGNAVTKDHDKAGVPADVFPEVKEKAAALQERGLTDAGAEDVKDITGLSETQTRVYRMLSGMPKHVDDIALEANLELKVVLAALTMLEIMGLASSQPGRRYTLTQK